MQCKESKHNETLKTSSSLKMLNEHLKKLIKAELRDKTVLNIKGTELTPKLSMDMISPPWKLPF
jgi:hypothetical protein